MEHTAKSIIQASLDVAQLEQEMVLARENHRELNRGLLELWVNQVRMGCVWGVWWNAGAKGGKGCH